MSASTPPRNQFTPLRFLLAIAFAAVGFVAVWQGFGLARCGTDAHTLRVLAAVATLFACGLVVVRPMAWRSRVAAVFAGLAVGGFAWWQVPSSFSESAMSLREASIAREDYGRYLANLPVEEAEQLEALKSRINTLVEQYPSLATDLVGQYDRRAAATADDIIARYRKAPPDDFVSAARLSAPAKALATAHPASADRLDTARRVWTANALHAKTDELANLKPGDWVGFDATAPGRRALAGALPESRDALVRAEAEWVGAAVEAVVANRLTPKAGDAPPTRDFWKHVHVEVLGLKSLDESDGRFLKARGRLFKAAHDTATAAALVHFEAGHYDLAFGVARAHAVEWSATAALLSEAEAQRLAALRATYEFFDALAAKSAKPPDPVEAAPPPRAKP